MHLPETVDRIKAEVRTKSSELGKDIHDGVVYLADQAKAEPVRAAGVLAVVGLLAVGGTVALIEGIASFFGEA